MIATLVAAALFARVTVLVPREGMQADFEAGYKRHLGWHREHQDPWTWLGWTVTTGERFGTFIDATVDRAATDFDAAVAPAEDAADNAKNVLPYARIASTAFYRVRPDLGRTTSADLRAPFASLITVRVRPADAARFERALTAAPPPAFCLELVNGGAAPQYVLIAPAAKLSALVAPPSLRDAAGVEAVTVEALRFRAELTYPP